jgi:hypothetical protein
VINTLEQQQTKNNNKQYRVIFNLQKL